MSETPPRTSRLSHSSEEFVVTEGLDLSSAPPRVRQQLEAGFRALLALDQGAVNAAMIEVTRDIQRPPQKDEFTKAVGPLSGGDVAEVAAALGMFAVLARTAGVDRTVAAIREHGFVSAEAETRLATLLGTAFEQEHVIRQLEQEEIGSRVLPNLTDLHWTVDLRVRYEGGRLSSSAPVVVLNVDTDMADQRLFCQMTLGQVERMIRTLERIKDRMNDLAQRAPQLMK